MIRFTSAIVATALTACMTSQLRADEKEALAVLDKAIKAKIGRAHV